MNSKIKDWIIKNKVVPLNLLNEVNSIPEDILDNLKRKKESWENKSIILTGEDSKYKDLTAIYFLLNYANINKKIIYCPHPNSDIVSSYATAIMRIELIKGTFAVSKISEIITNILLEDRVLILGCESLESVKSVFEGSFSNLIINSSSVFKIPTIRG